MSTAEAGTLLSAVEVGLRKSTKLFELVAEESTLGDSAFDLGAPPYALNGEPFLTGESGVGPFELSEMDNDLRGTSCLSLW